MGLGILLLDDINRADDRILRGLMQLLQEFEMFSWTLPPKWQIVCTANPEGGDYSVTTMDDAMLTRLLHVTMVFDLKAWARWALQDGVDPRGVSFVLTYPEAIIGKRTTPRTLTQFFDQIRGIADAGGSASSKWEGLEAPRSAEALDRILGQPCHGDHSQWAAHGGSGFGAGKSAEGPPLSEALRRALESAFDGQLVRARATGRAAGNGERCPLPFGQPWSRSRPNARRRSTGAARCASLPPAATARGWCPPTVACPSASAPFPAYASSVSSDSPSSSTPRDPSAASS